MAANSLYVVRADGRSNHEHYGSPQLPRSAPLACCLARSASPSRDHGEIGANHDRYIVKKKRGEEQPGQVECDCLVNCDKNWWSGQRDSAHYRTLLRVESADARQWYMNEAATQNWSSRALERQIGTLYYERLLLSEDKPALAAEADAKLQALKQAPREFIRDPVMLEFLGFPGSGKLLESTLEQALMDKLQAFLLELGKGFAFVARQQRISTESKDFYIDLVFYNYLLKCFVLIDLKTHELTHQDIGQMDMYVRMYDDLKRGPDDNPTVGILLCEHKDHSVVRYSVLHESEQLFASKYRLILPSEEELRCEIERERAILDEAQNTAQNIPGEGPA